MEEQTWKDANGKTAKARLMGMDGDRVVLLTADGQTRLPFKKFCRDDQNTIRKEMTAAGSQTKCPPRRSSTPIRSPTDRRLLRRLSKGRSPSNRKPKPNPPAATSPEPATQQEVAANSQPPKSTNSGGPAEAAHPLKEPSASGQQATTQPAAVQPARRTRDWPNDADEDIRFAARAIAACSQQARAECVVVAAESVPLPLVKSKVCSACGQKLPNTVKAGDSCPFCGVYLQYENTDQGPPVQVSSTFRSLCRPDSRRSAA